VTGIAWELGVVAGLAEHGVDLTTAGLIVGTSAGSVVGANLRSGAPVEDLYAEQLAEPKIPIPARRLSIGVLLKLVIAGLWPGDERNGRAFLGRASMAAKTGSEADRRRLIGSYLHSMSWPERRLLVTAVDAESGEFRVFDGSSGVTLADAVTASCAVPVIGQPITIDGRRYIDGGVRSIANVDLATGCERVVVIAPVTIALRRSGRIASQLARLGPTVKSVVVSPDPASRKAIGTNVFDVSRRAPAARAGRDQARDVAPAVGAVWN
jgi:NTE family protein